MPTEKNIKTPEILYKHFEGYKKHCKGNPKKENYWSNRAEKEVSISREIPFTWNGFEIWMRKQGIIANIDDYKANKDDRYSEYANILRTIGVEIHEDKFIGASVGIYQHNIIARDLGLVDKKDVTTKGDSINYSDLTKEEIIQKLDDIKKRIDTSD